MYTLYQTDAIVLARWPRGEHDNTLLLYTKEYGSVTLAAKGIRLEKSKLRGAVDLFCFSRVGFVAGKNAYRLTHADGASAFLRFQDTWALFCAAHEIARMVRSTIADGEPDTLLWQLLADTFTALNNSAYDNLRIQQVLYSFELGFLDILGYLPRELPASARSLLLGAGRPVGALSAGQLRTVALFLQPLREYAQIQKKSIL
jgi:DNA repair protein RecO (recombination protein O)